MLTDGEEQRQFIHIDDVCTAFHLALSERVTGIYDIASFEWCKVIDVAHMIGELTGAKVSPGAKRGTTPITPMVGKLANWQPTVSLAEGLERMVQAMARAN